MHKTTSPSARFSAFVAVFFLSSALVSPVLAAGPVNSSRFGKVAIDGYDAVAYLEASEAVEGDKKLTHEWNNAVWRFATAANRDLFAADPEKYAPQYGGYCAYAMSKGKMANIDPEAWTVVDGKLYLNYSKKVRTKWSSDIPGNIAAADGHWTRVLEEGR